jgi:hypothetical protein
VKNNKMAHAYKDVRLKSATKERVKMYAAKFDITLDAAVNRLIDMVEAQ